MAALGYPPMVVSLTPNVVPFYMLATTVTALAYGYHLRDRRYVAVGAAGLAAWLAQSSARTTSSFAASWSVWIRSPAGFSSSSSPGRSV